jgi:hypothetical protein
VATAVTINSVTTGDAVPTTAPHRISAKATKDSATVRFQVAGSGVVRAWRIRIGGTGLLSGLKAGGEGLICGESRCGEGKSLARPLGTEITEAVTYSEATPNADGSYSTKVYAATGDGWEA